MTPRRFITCVALALGLLRGDHVNAHPHVWVVMRGVVVFAPNGSVTGLRYTWAFDESLSASVAREAGTTPLTREGLAPLAQVNIDTLKESQFFTRATADGTEQKFGAPEEYWLAFEEGALTLHFTLPFKSQPRPKRLELEVYDPSYFTDITLDEKDPITLVNAPGQCTSAAHRQSWTQLANKIVVVCP
jgi:ABC-type uncharacterized transport system substrate-binding protein